MAIVWRCATNVCKSDFLLNNGMWYEQSSASSHKSIPNQISIDNSAKVCERWWRTWNSAKVIFSLRYRGKHIELQLIVRILLYFCVL